MKRIHLFEFEDLSWFPDWIRVCVTRMLIVMHRLLHTAEEMAELCDRAIRKSDVDTIIDLCAGSGGPMPEVVDILKRKYHHDIRLVMTDLYPNMVYASKINDGNDANIHYHTEPVDAANIDDQKKGLRTMVSSFHHMRPELAKKILRNAMDQRQPFCALEISDNSYPKALWWLTIPVNFLTSLPISLMARPMTWQQLVFTFIIPIIPITFAWDGAVSNARTYTLKDLEKLTDGLQSDSYTWEKGVIKGKSKKVYLLGLPA